MSRTVKERSPRYGRCYQGTPPTAYRKRWRREARVRQNRALRTARDLEELAIETKIQKLTSIYDWY